MMDLTGCQITLHWSDEDDAWLARVTGAYAFVTHGDTPEDALAMVRDAIAGIEGKR